MNEKDVVLSNDQWRVAVNVKEYVLRSIIYRKVRTPCSRTTEKKFTATSEIKQIELFIQILEDKLHDLNQILPRPDPRRV